MDSRSPRDGRVIEQLGTYDPSVPETDARAILNGERINYWLGVGAKPTRKVETLIKKYGVEGTHLEAQAEAISRLSARRAASIEAARDAATKVEMPKPEDEKPAEDAEGETSEAAEGEAAAEPAAESTDSDAGDQPAENADGGDGDAAENSDS